MHSFKLRYKSILYSVLVICLFQGIISDYLGFHQINYLCDALLIILLFVMICRKQLKLTNSIKKNIEFIPIIIFTVIVLFGWGLNSFSFSKALWGIRNYGRFFLFYALICACWTEGDVETVEKILMKLFPVHMSIVAFQYVVEGLNQDLLSGMFGRYAGGNAGLIIYLSIIFCIVVGQFEYKKISKGKFLCYLLLIFVNAALSELKFLFILSVVMVVWYIALSRHKGRGMVLALCLLIILYIGLQILYYVFPVWANYLSLENILNMISDQKTYATGLDVGRTVVFSRLSPIITNWGGKDALFFGIGLGNGDYSEAFSFLNSAFYSSYSLLHYTWLSLGFLFVETGYLGTIAYVSFFVILEIKAILTYQKRNTYYKLLGTFFPLVFLMIIVYNSSMRSNFAYMAFVVLAWQNLAEKSDSKEQGV